jgi:hypothetical protein
MFCGGSHAKDLESKNCVVWPSQDQWCFHYEPFILSKIIPPFHIFGVKLWMLRWKPPTSISTKKYFTPIWCNLQKIWPIIFTTPNNTSTSETYCLHIWFLSCSIENVILCTKTWWLVLHSAARGFLYLTIGVNILQLTYKNTLSSGTHPSNNILCKQNSLRTLTQCL